MMKIIEYLPDDVCKIICTSGIVKSPSNKTEMRRKGKEKKSPSSKTNERLKIPKRKSKKFIIVFQKSDLIFYKKKELPLINFLSGPSEPSTAPGGRPDSTSTSKQKVSHGKGKRNQTVSAKPKKESETQKRKRKCEDFHIQFHFFVYYLS